MKPRSRIWKAVYKNDRRKCRHRCRSCWKIVNPGEMVRFFRWSYKKTWLVHEKCENTICEPTSGNTWIDQFRLWEQRGGK